MSDSILSDTSVTVLNISDRFKGCSVVSLQPQTSTAKRQEFSGNINHDNKNNVNFGLKQRQTHSFHGQRGGETDDGKNYNFCHKQEQGQVQGQYQQDFQTVTRLNYAWHYPETYRPTPVSQPLMHARYQFMNYYYTVCYN